MSAEPLVLRNGLVQTKTNILSPKSTLSVEQVSRIRISVRFSVRVSVRVKGSGSGSGPAQRSCAD